MYGLFLVSNVNKEMFEEEEKNPEVIPGGGMACLRFPLLMGW